MREANLNTIKKPKEHADSASFGLLYFRLRIALPAAIIYPSSAITEDSIPKSPPRQGKRTCMQYIAHKRSPIRRFPNGQEATKDNDIPQTMHNAAVPHRAAFQGNEREHHPRHSSCQNHQKAAAQGIVISQNVDKSKEHRGHEYGRSSAPSLLDQMENHPPEDHFLHKPGGNTCIENARRKSLQGLFLTHLGNNILSGDHQQIHCHNYCREQEAFK